MFLCPCDKIRLHTEPKVHNTKMRCGLASSAETKCNMYKGGRTSKEFPGIRETGRKRRKRK